MLRDESVHELIHSLAAGGYIGFNAEIELCAQKKDALGYYDFLREVLIEFESKD